MKVKSIHQITGEVVELKIDTPEQIVQAWRLASEYGKLAERLKDQLKKHVPKVVNEKGLSEPIDGYMFRVMSVQRMNYDKAVLRKVFDEDTLDLFLQPNKPEVDKYLKEHLEEVGEGSTLLRNSMVATGSPYSVVKLEKL